MFVRVISTVGAVFVLTGAAMAGDLMRGLTITGGQNALARLKVERVNDPAVDAGTLTLRVSLSQVRQLKGYGLRLEYDPSGYAFLKAVEPAGNLLDSGAHQEPLFLTSDRTPGELTIAAARVDGKGGSGEGALVELVFRAIGGSPASDFVISEGVLVGVDSAVDRLSHVEVADLKPLPDQYVLDQCAPNPFNPSTEIGYELPEQGYVRLAVYNLLGQEVRVLVNETLQAGTYTATWDGRDAFGRVVASGVYVYRMRAGDFLASKRMLLLK